MIEDIDHLLVGCSNLDEGIAYVERLSGYRAVYGGAHQGRGTHNALLKMGPNSYLEILAPDPQQGELTWFKDIVSLSNPLLIGYAVRQSNLDEFAKTLRNKGIACIGPIAGSRARPDGQLLRWQTLFCENDRGGLLPFFIDWDPQSPHPSTDAPSALALLSFTGTGQLLEEAIPPPGKRKVQMLERPVQLRARLKGLQGEFELVSKSIPSETWSS